MCKGTGVVFAVIPTTAAVVVEKELYVQPAGKSSEYCVKVESFRKSPGGIIVSQRLSPGYNLDQLTLTTSDDTELSNELGLSEVTIDGVIYTATNPNRSQLVKD